MIFGIIGCRHGHIEVFIQEMLELGHTFVGICEGEGTLAAVLSKKYQVPLTADPDEIWAKNPDIIGTSTVNNRKLALIEECARRGVHLMLDKPLVTRREDLEKAKEILNNSSIQLGMLLTERYNPGLLALKQAVDQGLLGKITGFTIVKPHKLAPSTREPWLFSREENGGIVIDLLVHDFDLLRWIGGSEVADVSGWVQAGNWKDYPDFADDAKLLVRMEDGSTAALQTDWWTPDSHPNYGKGILICTGTLGKCVVYTTGDPVLHPGHGSFAQLTTMDREWGILPDPDINGSLSGDFLDRIAGKPGSISLEDIFRCTEATFLANESVQIIRRGSPEA